MAGPLSGALIVAAILGEPGFSFLDQLRREHFPGDRNWLSAHLTLFHALPPSAEDEARRLLGRLAQHPRPPAILDRPYSLGRGVAFRVRSPELESIRAEIADYFHGSLTSQDSAGWRPHVTVQNKVEPAIAQRLLGKLQETFEPRPLSLSGLALHRYAGGPWEPLAQYPFRGVS
jgi:hypothetical protein